MVCLVVMIFCCNLGYRILEWENMKVLYLVEKEKNVFECEKGVFKCGRKVVKIDIL